MLDYKKLELKSDKAIEANLNEKDTNIVKYILLNYLIVSLNDNRKATCNGIVHGAHQALESQGRYDLNEILKWEYSAHSFLEVLDLQ